MILKLIWISTRIPHMYAFIVQLHFWEWKNIYTAIITLHHHHEKYHRARALPFTCIISSWFILALPFLFLFLKFIHNVYIPVRMPSFNNLIFYYLGYLCNLCSLHALIVCCCNPVLCDFMILKCSLVGTNSRFSFMLA